MFKKKKGIFCIAKKKNKTTQQNTKSKIKRQVTHWEKIFAMYMMGKVLPFLMCKEVLKIKINNPIGKWAKDKKSSWKKEVLIALIM